METKVNLNSIYAPSEDIVVRTIEGEIIIVPLVSGIGDMEDELFTLNETGKAVWEKLDGKKSLADIAKELSSTFEADPEELKKDVLGIVRELLKRKMLAEVSYA